MLNLLLLTIYSLKYTIIILWLAHLISNKGIDTIS